MTPHIDPASEIKAALDREAGRRFRADRLVRALEADRPAAPAVLEGPLSRVPVPVQWIGVAAALIAATLGLRSLHLDLTAPEHRPASGTAEIARAQDLEGTPPPRREPAAPPIPPSTKDGPPGESPRRATGRGPSVPARSGDEVAPRVVEELATLEAPPASAAPPRATPTPAEPPPTTMSPAGSAPDTAAPPFGVFATVPGVLVGGVEIESLTFAERPLAALLRELPPLGATVLSVLGDQRNSSPTPRQAPSARGPDRSGASARPEQAQPAPVSYYVRLLGADGFEGPPREGHWVLGDDLRVTPLREAELWGDEGQRRILCKVFGSRTVIAASGAWVEGNQQASLVSSLGGTVYEASIRGTPEAEVLHRIEVRLARRPSLADSAAPIAAEVSLLVESGRVVVIAIPETLLFGRDPAARHGSLVLLALSPRSDPHEIPTIHVAEDVEDLPIPVDTPEPGYPEQARELHPGGDVVLRFVIRDDGGVDGVQLLELPAARGSEWLAAAAVRAVQEWRYLPARRHGRAVPSYLEATLGFTER